MTPGTMALAGLLLLPGLLLLILTVRGLYSGSLPLWTSGASVQFDRRIHPVGFWLLSVTLGGGGLSLVLAGIHKLAGG